MYDYGLSVLSHYGLTASGTMRVRGALLCHTEQGDKLISEFGTAAEKLEQRYLLQCRITESGLLRCDQILRNEEGALATRGTTEERTLCGTGTRAGNVRRETVRILSAPRMRWRGYIRQLICR